MDKRQLNAAAPAPSGEAANLDDWCARIWPMFNAEFTDAVEREAMRGRLMEAVNALGPWPHKQQPAQPFDVRDVYDDMKAAQQAEPLYPNAPDCYDGWPEHDTTTPQAEAQAGETRAIKPDWKAMYESQVQATLAQADRADRAEREIGEAMQAASAAAFRERELRAQLAAQDRLEEATSTQLFRQFVDAVANTAWRSKAPNPLVPKIMALVEEARRALRNAGKGEPK